MGAWQGRPLLPPRARDQTWLPGFPRVAGAITRRAALPSTMSFGSLAPSLWVSAQGCAAPAALSSLPLHFQSDLFLLLCSSAVFLAIKPTPGFFCMRLLMQRAAAAPSQQLCPRWWHRWKPRPLLLWCMSGSRNRHPATGPAPRHGAGTVPLHGGTLGSWPDPALADAVLRAAPGALTRRRPVP